MSDYPDSPWLPSLRANLACYYREHGRYTKALQHWELAWSATHTAKEGSAKSIADFTFAHWTRLLGSLGRVDTLRSLFEETQNRIFDAGPLQQIINGTKEGYRDMLTQPGDCFKCGTFALINVAKTIKGSRFDAQPIDSIPSPVIGFNMTQLSDLSEKFSLDLVPVEWAGDKEIIVPSIIHWKQDHFAAILEKKNDRYRVVDPTFEQARWLRASEIIEEASGHFFVRKAQMPSSWRMLAAEETGRIFGRGRPPATCDSCDSCGNGSGGGAPSGTGSGNNNSSSSDPAILSAAPAGGGGCPPCGASGSGGSGQGCCPPDGGGGNQGGNPNGSSTTGAPITASGGPGMPVWDVSEPYISVWLYDRPLPTYQPGLGYPVSFKLAYKQRETKTVSSSIFSLGNMWNCSWLSYVTFDGTNDPAPGMAVPGGGDRTYSTDGVTREFFSDTTLQLSANASQTNYVISYASGAKDYYGYVIPFQMKQAAFLTDRVDPYGHTNHFVYLQTNSATLLKYVIDADGRTNTLFYTNNDFPAQITGVQDPFGHMATLKYDSTGMLTNITDSASLSNSFKYHGSLGWVTNMITPYGTTTFSYTTNTSSANEFSGPSGPSDFENFIIRSARIVDPAGGTNIYILRQDCHYLTNPISGDPEFFLPDTLPYPTPPETAGIGDNNLEWRNTFHWGPKQAAGLPADLNLLTISDHTKARWRHWRHDFSSLNISHTLGAEIEPSPDGINYGQATFYAYDGEELSTTHDDGQGTNSQPCLIITLLSDGGTSYSRYTWFRRDEWDRPTNIVTTYSTGFAQEPLTRTNKYVYSGADLVKHIGPRGETLEGYAYDGNHQLLRATNAVGDVWYYTYDAKGRLTQTISPSGLSTINIYFASGDYANWVATNIDLEINRTNSFIYTNDLVYTHTDERGLITTNTYDALNRITSSADSRGTIAYTYDKLDLIQVVDRMGFTNRYVYDNVRRLIAHTNALGKSTLYNYCDCGALDSIRDAEGNFTYYFYDNAGRMTNVVYADGFSVTNLYNLLGELTNVVDSSGYSVSNWFNNQGLRFAVSTVSGNQTYIDFDDEDRATNVINSEGVSTAMTYDDLGRLRTRTYPDGGVETFGYSVAGLVAFTNQIGMTNFFTYDAAGRKTFETNANSELIRYTNNAAGDLISLTDGKNQTTRWNYDQYGRVTNKLDQLGAEILRYKYDPNNRLTNRWSAAKGDTKYSYDPIGNLTNINYLISPDVAFAYDAMNRMTNMVDGAGTTKYSYSAAGQLLSEDGPFANDIVTNGYSNRLRTSLSLQQPTGLWTNGFGYDTTKRLTNVTSPAGAFGYAYDPALFTHHASRITLPNTSYITNAFDSNARLIATYLKKSDNTIFDSYTYIYNPANQRTNLARADASTMAYTYDKIGQLKFGRASVSPEGRAYLYDGAWNLTVRTNNTGQTTFTVDNRNQLSTDSFNTHYFYDTNGNLSWSQYGSDPLTWTTTEIIARYEYDDENRLIGWTNFDYNTSSSPQQRTEFYYDGLGRLRKRIEYQAVYEEGGFAGFNWSSEAHYIYDGWRVIQERDLNNTPTVSYTRGKDLSGSMEGAGGIGGLLARSDGYSSGNFTTHNYYFADGNGNITYMLNSSQAMVAKYRYDPFGSTISSSGTLVSANVYRFSSKEIHANSGMYYYGYRFYDPNLQRWINSDPLWDSPDAPALAVSEGNLPEVTLAEAIRNVAAKKRGIMPSRFASEQIEARVTSLFARNKPPPADPARSQFHDFNFYRFVENTPVGFVDPDGRVGIQVYPCVGYEARDCALECCWSVRLCLVAQAETIGINGRPIVLSKAILCICID